MWLMREDKRSEEDVVCGFSVTFGAQIRTTINCAFSEITWQGTITLREPVV